jgi:hypothetical protein
MAAVCTCGSVTVSVMPAGCRVSVRHILEVWTPSPVHFHTRSGQFDWDMGVDSEKSTLWYAVRSVGLSRTTISNIVTPSIPQCRGDRQHRRHPHRGNGVPWRQGGGPTARPRDERGLSSRTPKSRAREPAASMRTVTLRARAVKLAEGAPGERRPPERLPSVRSANAKRATPTMSRRSQAPPL